MQKRLRGPVHKSVIHYALQIVQDMLDSLPVSEARIRVELGKNSCSIGNVRPCGECQIYEWANNRDVGILAHFCSFCGILG
jgi:hypothetical protein